MKPENNIKLPKNSATAGQNSFFKKLGRKVASLFEPEEVEVTFKEEGSTKSYTYTKVHQKQVA